MKRISFIILLFPLLQVVGQKDTFKAGEDLKFNIGMGYTMAPFGDFIDENIWIKYRDWSLLESTRKL